MRTTIAFDDDVAPAVTRLRREAARGVSEIVNDLIRVGLRERTERRGFFQPTEDLGLHLDVTKVGEALSLLDGPAQR